MLSKLGPNSASGTIIVCCTFPERFAIGGSGGAGNSFSGDNSRGGECQLFPEGECI